MVVLRCDVIGVPLSHRRRILLSQWMQIEGSAIA
jgi:hypothetical protein